MTADPEFAELLQRTNHDRASAGLAPLRWNTQLAQAAQLHAEYLADGGFLSHGGAGGSNPSDRAEARGYAWQVIGENVLCRTRRDTAAAYAQWWNSEGHRANLLGAQYRDTGLGRAYSPRVDCWYYAMLLAA